MARFRLVSLHWHCQEGSTKSRSTITATPIYRWTSSNFSLTNPPIPGGASAGGSGNGGSLGNGPQGTATAQGTVSVTTTTESGTPTVVGAGNVTTTTHARSGDNGGLWLIVILALVGLIVIGGAVGAGIFLIRHARVSAGMGPQASPDFYAPPSSVPSNERAWPPLYEDR
ncbi:MAG TPA: hypothetical protein VFW76_06675 [Ktedonobacterales bacterium]|nr:hypothetical protein [Ktedonobacterales bacterium]